MIESDHPQTSQHAGQTPVHVDAAAGDITRGVRSEESNDVGHFFRLSHALHRHSLAGIRIMLLDSLVVARSATLLLLGFDFAHRNDVDQDVVRREFFRQPLGQRQTRGTAHRGRKHRRARLLRTHHVQVDDAAAADFFHMRHGCTRGAHLRHDLDFHVEVPEIVIDFVESNLARTAGVVDHNVEATEMFCGLLDEALHIAFLGRIGNHAKHVTTLFFQICNHRVDQFLAPRAERNLHALCHQAPNGRAADAFGATRYCGNLALESEFHDLIPFAMRWLFQKVAIVTQARMSMQHGPRGFPAQTNRVRLHAAMIIAIPDDYHNLVRTLDCMKRLAGHEVRIFNDAAPPSERLLDNLRDADIIVPIRERTRFTAGIIQQLPKLKLFSQTGRSCHHINLDACNAHGIAVAAGSHASPYTVAEQTWAMILGSLREIPAETALMKAGQWRSRFSFGLKGRTLGIYGLGTIGSLVAATGASFGMRVLVWGRDKSLAAARAAGYETASGREQLFAESDVLVLMIRLSKETRGLVTTADLARMKPSALLVNTARAELIAPGVLETALKAGRPGFAAVDVYENEPVLGGNHPLLGLDNALCSHHSAWLERETYELYFGEAFANAAAFAAGQPLKLVNTPRR